MRLQLLILSLLLMVQTGFTQSADDFFHGGAQSYLSNNLAKATEIVGDGLKLYPGDIKLKKLEELLKQQSQQQSQDSQSQQNQQNQPSKNDQQQKSQSQQQKHQQPDSKQPQQSKSEEKKPEQKQAQKSSGEEKKQSEPKDQEPGKAYAAGQMTPQEARQLLDSQKDDELMLPVSRKEKASNSDHPIKDW